MAVAVAMAGAEIRAQVGSGLRRSQRVRRDVECDAPLL